MKELSIEEKAKSYDKVREKIALRFGSNVAEEIFSEFEESEDESIRKELIDYCKNRAEKYSNDPKYKNISAWIAWLERQGEQKPNFCHHEVDLSDCSEEYCKAYYDGWNNCNMQHSQCKLELEDVAKCLINGMKFYYEDDEEATWGTDKWSMPVKHIIEVLEKQCEQKPINNQFTPEQADILDKHIDEFIKQYPPNWSEENERMLELLGKAAYTANTYKDKCKIKNWFKSLKPHNTWKPSEFLEELKQAMKGE